MASFWLLLTAAFAMIHLIPGDPVRAAMGPSAPIVAVTARRHLLGLDRPFIEQYITYMRQTLTGNLGTSIGNNLPVSQIISQRFPATMLIAGLAFVVVMLISLPTGILMAVSTRGGRRPGINFGFASFAILLGAIPNFLLGVGFVYLFAVRLHWLPVAGRSSAGSYVLPVLALSLGTAAAMARIVRTEMLAVLDNDYIRTARAKRLPGRIVYLRHAFPNALTTTLTLSGIVLTGLVAGTVFVENVFAWPGLGTEFVQSITAKDYPVMQGMVLVYGSMILIVNLMVDLVLALIDPRSRLREG